MYRAVRRGSIHYRKFPRAADDTVQRVRIAGAVDELHSLALFLKMGRDAPQQGRFAAAWAGLQKGRGLCFRIFYWKNRWGKALPKRNPIPAVAYAYTPLVHSM